MTRSQGLMVLSLQPWALAIISKSGPGFTKYKVMIIYKIICLINNRACNECIMKGIEKSTSGEKIQNISCG